jgi:SAM-dependent methyltransferase
MTSRRRAATAAGTAAGNAPKSGTRAGGAGAGAGRASRPRAEFDAAFYRRFYLDSATRVHDPRSRRRLADFVLACLDHLGIPVRRVLDVGCGLGHWRVELARRRPGARYTGVETSGYLCDTLGWERGAADTWRGRGRHDLVICQSVLQYLDDRAVARSLANLARQCRGALYLEVVTREDWRRHCDRETTDGHIHLRPAAWYRKAIARHFRAVGGGIFLPKDSPVVLYELERGG